MEKIGEDNLLFESSWYKGKPLTRFWAYTTLRQLEKKLPKDLLKDLDFIDHLGQEKLHFFTHWFRSQRASQLVHDYQFQVLDLLDWFSWKTHNIATLYVRRGWRGLASKMTIHKYT